MSTPRTGRRAAANDIRALRQHYRPRPDRMPAWLKRLWHWL